MEHIPSNKRKNEHLHVKAHDIVDILQTATTTFFRLPGSRPVDFDIKSKFAKSQSSTKTVQILF